MMSPNNPAEGRWLTPDMLGGDVTNPRSLNRYAYVLNNPATLTDPLGLDPYDGPPGENCSDQTYADSNARCGWDPCTIFTPEGWSQSNCSGLPAGVGGGGIGSTLPPVPPAGQPPLAGGSFVGGAATGAAGQDVIDLRYLGPIAYAISRACRGNNLCIEILTGGAEELGTAVGIAGVIGSTILMKGDGVPSARARSRGIPTIAELQQYCKPGRRVVEPSTSRAGWTSEEQEYICDGIIYTVHCLVSPTGAVRDCHVRPGPPKGGALLP